MQRPIRLTRVKQNNLKNISVELPPKKITVVTGLSGSGKSSLVFDTLYAEGQRRYVESLSTYTRQFLEKMPKPDLESIENIPPAIALEQKNHVVNSRSTVGTQTEIVDYLRLLFAKVGKTICPDCQTEVKQVDAQSILEWTLRSLTQKPQKSGDSQTLYIVAPFALPTAKTKKKAAEHLAHLFHLFQEQGFTRVLSAPKGKKKPEVLEISEIVAAPKDYDFDDTKLYLVVDRMKVGADELQGNLSDLRLRLREATEQALQIGQSQMGIYQPDSSAMIQLFAKQFACANCGREFRRPEPNLFSFNSPVGACSHCNGFGHTLDIDENLVVPDPTKTIKNGAIDPLSKPSFSDYQKDMFRFLERRGVSVGKRYQQLTAAEKNLIWKGDPKDDTFPGILGVFEELKRYKYKLHIRVFVRRYQSQTICRVCDGARLHPDALAVKVSGQTIHETLNQPVTDSLKWIREAQWTPNEKKISAEILFQVERRLAFLEEVGVGYLTLSRLAKTLSGGEFQRINLATQLGNGLCGTLYVLDEPSIGLHASDTSRLIRVLKRLRDQGNTVVVVEHDLEIIRAADWLVELGPAAGAKGGELVAQATARDLAHIPHSVTGKYLAGTLKMDRNHPERAPARRVLRLTGARENNLKDLTIDFPLDRLVVVTGLSGSGKSTLIHKTLYPALARVFYGPAAASPDSVGDFDRIYGAEQLSGVVLLDQSPIGKSSRSNPATYLKAWDEIRRVYSQQSLALRRGFTPQHFSFNVDGGRCPVCKGAGEITLDMHFMAEITIPCEECEGKRFKKNVLDITYRGKDVNQLLNTTIDEAYEIFRDHPMLRKKLGTLRDVGLGYLNLGQSATTLSGGESQRLKIASTLDESHRENLLYLFDEPTTGLHLEDVKRLIGVVQDLVDAKNSVIIIEHHPDVIAQADWVLDLGPEGGKNGGHLLAAGTPRDLCRNDKSITGQTLLDLGYYPDLRSP